MFKFIKKIFSIDKYVIKYDYDNGSEVWYVNNKLHRLDGPAMEWADGTKFWYINDKLYRVDGPAIEWSDGSKHWFVDGEECINKLEYNQAIADYKRDRLDKI